MTLLLLFTIIINVITNNCNTDQVEPSFQFHLIAFIPPPPQKETLLHSLTNQILKERCQTIRLLQEYEQTLNGKTYCSLMELLKIYPMVPLLLLQTIIFHSALF